jgi:hypothetical protein
LHPFTLTVNFKVLVEGKLSSPRKIAEEVPQGFVLAPVLYGLYINDASAAPGMYLAFSGTIPACTSQRNMSVVFSAKYNAASLLWDRGVRAVT